MSDILSRLPTEDAIRTTTLSKDWKYKWTCMYHIDINDFVSGVPGNTESFGNFVDNVVSFAQNLKSFRISCKGIYDLSRATTWIYEMLRRDSVQCLELLCWSSFKDKGIVLPWSLLDRSSLKSLELAIPNCTFSVTSMNSFLNLKTFHLCEVQILNGNPTSNILIINFPVLENFQVTRCKWVDVKFVKIYAPMLSTFTSETSDLDGPNNYSIEIIGSRVSTFKCSGGFPDNVILNGSQVVSTSLDNYYDVDKLADPIPLVDLGCQVLKLLNESSRLNELELSKFITITLLSGRSPPRYSGLKRLCLLDPNYTEELFSLLHPAPLLKVLSVNVLEWDGCDYDAEELRMPSCIKSHLEEVHLHCFEGEPYQYDFAKFLLKTGRVLKELAVHHPPWFQAECVELKNKLSWFPKISTNVRIIASVDADYLPLDDC